MWPKILNSKLFASLLTITITVITTITVQGFVSKNRYKEIIKDDLEKKASIEYVDKQDAHISSSLNQHIVESKETDEKVMELIKSIDNKLNILITRK